jgi:hypothetical protein
MYINQVLLISYQEGGHGCEPELVGIWHSATKENVEVMCVKNLAQKLESRSCTHLIERYCMSK